MSKFGYLLDRFLDYIMEFLFSLRCLVMVIDKCCIGRRTQLSLHAPDMGLLSVFQSLSEARIPISQPHSVWCCDWKPCVSAYRSCRICSSDFLLTKLFHRRQAWSALSMYLPHEVQKSSTAALTVHDGVVPDLPLMPSKAAHRSLIGF